MSNYFTETIEIGSVNIALDKLRITGSVTERWDQILSRSISCGDKYKRTVERTVGVSETQREDLETFIKGNVGIKGIAQIESEIQSSIGKTVTLSYNSTEREEREFEAPKCGRRTLIIYQQIREYNLQITKEVSWPFQKNSTHVVLIERLDSFYDKSIVEENDPDCKCSKKSDDPVDGLLALLLNGNYRINTPYSLSDGKITLKNLDLVISAEDAGRMLIGNYKLNRDHIPDYMVFWSKIKETSATLSIKTDGNIAFDYNQKIRFNQEYQFPAGPIISFQDRLRHFERPYGFVSPFDVNNPFGGTLLPYKVFPIPPKGTTYWKGEGGESKE